MRRQKEITSLECPAVLPKHDNDFLRYKQSLGELVKVNFGADLDYDEFSQTFYFQKTEHVYTGDGPNVLTAKRTFEIDPRQNLLAEFARIDAEIDNFQEFRRLVARAAQGTKS